MIEHAHIQVSIAQAQAYGNFIQAVNSKLEKVEMSGSGDGEKAKVKVTGGSTISETKIGAGSDVVANSKSRIEKTEIGVAQKQEDGISPRVKFWVPVAVLIVVATISGVFGMTQVKECGNRPETSPPPEVEIEP